MTRKAKESKVHLNPQHSTLLEAFETISKSGFVKVLLTVVGIGATLIWRVETMSDKVSDISTLVKEHDDSLEAHTLGVWHRPVATRDTVTDTISRRIVELQYPKVHRSPFGGSVTEESE